MLRLRQSWHLEGTGAMGAPRIKYDSAAAIDALTRATAGKRRHLRRSGIWAAVLELGKGERCRCMLVDLSAGGAKLLFGHAAQHIAKGRIVALSSQPLGTRWGRIAWTSGRSAGLEFLDAAPATLAPAASRANADFLRRRSEILRGLARRTSSGNAAAKLLSTAEHFDAFATSIEAQLPPATLATHPPH
jgi:hypothetical protein